MPQDRKNQWGSQVSKPCLPLHSITAAPGESPPGRRVMRMAAVLRVTAIASKSGVYALIKNADFPRPIRIGKRRVGWLADEVEAWLMERIKERDQDNMPAFSSGRDGACP